MSIKSALNPVKKPHTIIIGAGCAGLAAAGSLVQKGHKVTILEASSRLFGRVQTTQIEGIEVDLGAAWIHGDTNPLLTRAKKLGVNLVRDQHQEICASKYISPEAVYGFTKRYTEELKKRKNGSLAPIGSPDKLISDLVELQFSIADAGEDANLLSAADSISIASRAAGSFPEGGMEKLMMKLFGKLLTNDDCKIIKDTAVTEIRYARFGRGHEVIITDIYGDEHHGDYVVVTTSVGVLKSGMIKFMPTTPPLVKDICEKIEMGSMNKIILKMSDSFFVENKIPNTVHLNFLSPDLPPLFALARPGGKPIIMALIGGEHSRTLEQTGKDAMTDWVVNHLEKAYGVGVKSSVEKSICTAWNNNPFTLGSYSVLRPGTPLSIRKPKSDWNNRLFVAGEAFGGDYATHVWGAVSSGRRAALQISKTEHSSAIGKGSALR